MLRTVIYERIGGTSRAQANGKNRSVHSVIWLRDGMLVPAFMNVKTLLFQVDKNL